MNGLIKTAALLGLSIICAAEAYSLSLPTGHYTFEAGEHFSTQGKSQNIYIQNVLGDHYSLSKSHDNNWLLGVGYLFDGYRNNRLGIDYGINAYYLGDTKTSGQITQEFVFTNLAYDYQITHIPVYAMLKAHYLTHRDNLLLTAEAGIGPNLMTMSQFHSWSLDGGITQPDRAFKRTTNITLSAMVGVGIRFNNIWKEYPLEIGYKFFYLGHSSLSAANPQILNNLDTGRVYTQALVFSTYI